MNFSFSLANAYAIRLKLLLTNGPLSSFSRCSFRSGQILTKALNHLHAAEIQRPRINSGGADRSVWDELRALLRVHARPQPMPRLPRRRSRQVQNPPRLQNQEMPFNGREILHWLRRFSVFAPEPSRSALSHEVRHEHDRELADHPSRWRAPFRQTRAVEVDLSRMRHKALRA